MAFFCLLDFLTQMAGPSGPLTFPEQITNPSSVQAWLQAPAILSPVAEDRFLALCWAISPAHSHFCLLAKLVTLPGKLS